MAYQEPTDAHAIQDHRTAWKDNKGNMRPGYLEGGPKEFPKLMYPKVGGFPKQVADPAEQAKAEKEGYTDTAKGGSLDSFGRYSPPKEEASEPVKPEAPKATEETPKPTVAPVVPFEVRGSQPPKKG